MLLLVAMPFDDCLYQWYHVNVLQWIYISEGLAIIIHLFCFIYTSPGMIQAMSAISMMQNIILLIITITKVRGAISSPLLTDDAGVGLPVITFVLRHKIHPCIRWTTGGTLICISAVTKSINCWAVDDPSWWTILVILPVWSSKQVRWGWYKLLYPSHWHVELNHFRRELFNSINNLLLS